jgi:hypothetical protein
MPAGVAPLALAALRDYHAHLNTSVAEVRAAATGAHPAAGRGADAGRPPRGAEVRELLEAALKRLEDST